MKKRLEGRTTGLKPGQPVTQILGIELFEDTQILRVAVFAARYEAVGTADCKIFDDDVDFPLADLAYPGVPNATIIAVALRLHPGQAITAAGQFRYHHRDSMSDGALDLKRRYYCELDQDPDAWIANLAEFVPGVVGDPIVMDVSHLDVMAAIEAIKAMPFCLPNRTH